jgi:hypothetical protein
MNIFTAHPKLVTMGIGLAVTFVVGTAIGMVDHNNLAYATACASCNHNGNGN